MVQEKRVSKRLGLQACRLLEARRRELIKLHGCCASVPDMELKVHFEKVVERVNGGVVTRRKIVPKYPKNDIEALRIIEALKPCEPLIDETWIPSKQPLPDENNIRWPWVKFGWYYHDATGRLHWKTLDWSNDETKRFAVSHLVKLMKTKGKELWDITRNDFEKAELKTLLTTCPKPLQTFHALVEYGDVRLTLADLTRFRMSPRFHDDEKLQLIYAIAVVHRIAKEAWWIKSYSRITGMDIQRLGGTSRNAQCLHISKFRAHVLKAIEDGLLPRSINALRKQMKEGTAHGIELFIDEIKRRNGIETREKGKIVAGTTLGID